MPIEVQEGPLRRFSQEDFHELDHTVMGITFEVHNQFGRLLDELLYKREIAARCMKTGIPTEREVRIWVTHGTFTKEYSIDLVFSHGVVYEAKAVEWLAPAHEAQTLNGAFAVSAVTESTDGMRTHLSRFLAHTRLHYVQWINLNHHGIEFITLSR